MNIGVGTAVAYLELDKSRFTSGLKGIGADLKNVVSGTTKVGDKFKSLGSAVGKVGSALKAPSVASGGFLAHALKTSTDFQAQMSKVQAISGASAKDMVLLSNKAREWGAKTKFSAKECGDAFEYMGMAGWKTNEMLAGLPGILNLASASGEELGTTSDIVTDALTAFGLKASDSAHFADLLAQASTNSNTNVSMLGESFKYCAPICGALGMNAKDCTFALGLMANAGIKGSTAGTTLRSALTNLSNPTGNMAKKMAKLGISMTDAKGKVKPLKTILDELRQKFGKLTKAQQAEYASTIFGKTAMSGMLSIINASKEDYDKLYTSVSNCDGVATKMSNTMQNNVKGALTNLKSAFEELEIGLTQALVPALTKIIQYINKLINKFNALPQPVKDVVAKVLVGIMALSPVLLIFSKIITTVGSVIGAISKLGSAFKGLIGVFKGLRTGLSIIKTLPALISPHILLIVAIVGTLAFAVYEVIKHWGKIKPFFSKLWNGVKSIFSKFWGWLKGFVGKWGVAIIAILNPFLGIPLLIIKKWSVIKPAFSKLGNAIKSICGKISATFKAKIAEWGATWKGFISFMGKVGHWICDGLLGGLKAGWNKVSGFVGKMASGIKSKFKSILGIHSPSRVFKAYGGFIGEGLIEGLDGMNGKISEKVNGIGSIIKNLTNFSPNFAQLKENLGNVNIGANLHTKDALSRNGMKAQQQLIKVEPKINVYLQGTDVTTEDEAKITARLKQQFTRIINETIDERMINDAFTSTGF